METPTQKIHGLLKKFDTAMLVTHGHDTIEHARPMGIAHLEENCDLWFFTDRVSEKTREIQQDAKVLLVFQKDYGISFHRRPGPALGGQSEGGRVLERILQNLVSRRRERSGFAFNPRQRP